MSFVRHAMPLVAALALVAQPAYAAASLVGDWSMNAAKSDDVEKAIEKALEKVNFVIRGFAKGRLESTNKPYKTVAISKKGGDTIIKVDDRAPIVAPSDGKPIKWTREDGQKYDVAMTWKGETRLEESFTNDEGKRVNVFTLDGDGKGMAMEVTVSSPKLPVPLTYKIAYKRN